MRVPFVDAHVHFWDLARPGYDWLRPPFRDDVPGGSPESIATTYLLDDYLAETAGWNLAGFIHVDAGAGADQARAETLWLQQIADARGRPNGIVAFADLRDPEVEALLAFHAAHANVRGIRQIVNWHADPARSYHPRDMVDDPAWHRGYALLGKYGLSFDLQAYPGQFARLAALIERHDDVPVVIDHLGMPIETDGDGWDTWRRGLAGLAALPHVAIKVSGAGFIHRDWSANSVRAAVLETIALFGTERVLIASNFPTDRMFATMDHTLGAYETILAGFSEKERRDLWGRNANRIYRLGLDLGSAA
jgi:predicted TIM-barrel fold metal-dependent hydrolase